MWKQVTLLNNYSIGGIDAISCVIHYIEIEFLNIMNWSTTCMTLHVTIPVYYKDILCSA